METLATVAACEAFLARPGPLWLIKHSRICPISADGLAAFRSYLDARPGEAAGLVVVQDHRPVSDHLARRFGIRHESPQAFLVEGGRVLWHASHGGIAAAAMAAARGDPPAGA